MLRNDTVTVWLVTLYFLVTVTLLQFGPTRTYALFMAVPAPFLLCWMVYRILKYGQYNGPELGHEEFGYQDKPNDQSGRL